MAVNVKLRLRKWLWPVLGYFSNIFMERVMETVYGCGDKVKYKMKILL